MQHAAFMHAGVIDHLIQITHRRCRHAEFARGRHRFFARHGRKPIGYHGIH
jgi:hypothetical protein